MRGPGVSVLSVSPRNRNILNKRILHLKNMHFKGFRPIPALRFPSDPSHDHHLCPFLTISLPFLTISLSLSLPISDPFQSLSPPESSEEKRRDGISLLPSSVRPASWMEGSVWSAELAGRRTEPGSGGRDRGAADGVSGPTPYATTALLQTGQDRTYATTALLQTGQDRTYATKALLQIGQDRTYIHTPPRLCCRQVRRERGTGGKGRRGQRAR